MSWQQVGASINGTNYGGQFGNSIDINSDGTVVVVGAPDAQRVGVYNWNGTQWVQRGSDIIGIINGRFGYDVNITSDGTIIAASDPKNNQVRVYKWDNTSWNQIGANIIGGELNSQFGTGMSINSDNGTIIAIGAFDTNGSNGIVYMYNFIGGSWVQMAPGSFPGIGSSRFGFSVAMNGNGSVMAVGGYGAASTRGITKIYYFNGVNWIQRGIRNKWNNRS